MLPLPGFQVHAMSMRTDPVGNPSPRPPSSPGHPYALHRPAKHEALIPELNRLTRLHYAGCAEYRRLADVLHGGLREFDRCEDFPYLPVRLFKHYDLRSVPEADLIRTLTSSGTSGQAVSRIHLDKETATRQTRALTEITGSFIGSRRLPMLIVDCPATLAKRASFSARTAGILGFSIFGRNPTHALDDDMQIDTQAIEAFLARHGEAQEITRLDHPRSIWRLDIEDFNFYYQVLSTVIEVGDIVAKRTGSSFEPTQDLLAEFTAEEAA